MIAAVLPEIRHDWTTEQIHALFNQPLMDLLFQAQTVHRKHFDPNQVQMSTLLSIKTGACPEDCGYCSQSGHHNTNLEKERLISVEEVIAKAKLAKEKGASRFCMGAAWRSPPKKDLPKVIEMIKGVKSLGMETCVTLGMLDNEQATLLKEAGLDYYNHNLDSSPEYYKKVTSTRTYQDRLDTLSEVREAGLKTCCGGIVSMGESPEDRIELLRQLANLPEHPPSVPINLLVPIKGTPLGESKKIDHLDFVRLIACARIIMPKSVVRLSAGRTEMSEETQALCFLAGANSVFLGEVLLTTPNPAESDDYTFFNKIGIEPMDIEESEAVCTA